MLKYTKSAFERQILESVQIQANRHHHLLNSRSEYNRCAVPRLACKLGDKEFKLFEKEVEKDLKKEEDQVNKIKNMKTSMLKEKSKTRHRGRDPPTKRRKIDKNQDIEEEEQIPVEEIEKAEIKARSDKKLKMALLLWRGGGPIQSPLV